MTKQGGEKRRGGMGDDEEGSGTEKLAAAWTLLEPGQRQHHLALRRLSLLDSPAPPSGRLKEAESDGLKTPNPLYPAAKQGEVLKVDAKDRTLRTPLLEAIVNDHVEVTRYLVQSGASVYHMEDDTATRVSITPPRLGNLHIVQLLLETGQVDINAQDSGGWTPIIWAAEHKHMDVIRALLQRGADATIQDK
ncbi:hypothetical protein CRUP_023323, partial [Coryphaenoides rupestris]